MSLQFCNYHTNKRANSTCTKCNVPLCSDCNQDNLCPLCHYNANSIGKQISEFIGISLFFAPFFGGAFILSYVIYMSRSSGILWFLILFAIAWIGGVVIGYINILRSFIQSFKKSNGERKKRNEFMNEMGIDRHGKRKNSRYALTPPLYPSKSPFEQLNTRCSQCNMSTFHRDDVTLRPMVSMNPPHFVPSGIEDHVFCYKCGKQLPSDALFCLQCGVALNYSRLYN